MSTSLTLLGPALQIFNSSYDCGLSCKSQMSMYNTFLSLESQSGYPAIYSLFVKRPSKISFQNLSIDLYFLIPDLYILAVYLTHIHTKSI